MEEVTPPNSHGIRQIPKISFPNWRTRWIFKELLKSYDRGQISAEVFTSEVYILFYFSQ